MDILTREFYSRDTLAVARDLLGRDIVRVREDGKRLVCRITETEAYIGRLDKACHAYGYKRTPRTETLFAPPGTAYIYLIYGMYHCLNFVTEGDGEPAAVLIRGAVPVTNGDIIAENRFHDIDAVITTRELVKMIRSAHISPDTLEDRASDRPMQQGSGAGVIFGVTGGVMEAAFRSAYYLLKKENPPADAFKAVRSPEFQANDGVMEAEFSIDDVKVRTAVVSGLGNTRALLNKIAPQSAAPYCEGNRPHRG